MLKTFDTVSAVLDKFCKFLLILSISVLIVIMSAQIIARAGFNSGISWADGLARYMLIWSTFLGATCATKESSHVTLTFIPDMLKGKALKAYNLVIWLVTVAFAVMMSYIGIMVVQAVMPQKADSIAISVAFIYGAIPFAHIVMIVHLLAKFLHLIKPATLDPQAEQAASGGI